MSKGQVKTQEDLIFCLVTSPVIELFLNTGDTCTATPCPPRTQGSPGPFVLSLPDLAPDKGGSAEKVSQILGTEGGCRRVNGPRVYSAGSPPGGSQIRHRCIASRTLRGQEAGPGGAVQSGAPGAVSGLPSNQTVKGRKLSYHGAGAAIISREPSNQARGRARSHLVDVNPRSPRARAPPRGAGTCLGPQCGVEDAWRARSGAARG